MLGRWIERMRWRGSPRFGEAVALALAEIEASHGPGALAYARTKAKRRYQPLRRKWVWREVVRRLEASRSTNAARKVER